MQEQNDQVQSGYEEHVDTYDDATDQSPFERFGKVFFNPREAFTGLLGNRQIRKIIAWGLLVVSIIQVFSGVLISSNPKIAEDARRLSIEAFDKMVKEGELKPEKRDEVIKQMDDSQQQGTFGVMLKAFGQLVLYTILSLLFALVMLGLARWFEVEADDRLTFGVIWAVAIIAMMVLNFGDIVNAILQYLTGKSTMNLSLAQFFSIENWTLLFVISWYSLFFFWWVISSGVGIATVSKSNSGKAIAVFGGIMMIVLVVAAFGLSALFKLGMGA